MITVATYWWCDTSYTGEGHYSPDDVKLLQRQVARHLTAPHQFVCITEFPEAFEEDGPVRAVPMHPRTHIAGTCFARLFTFSPEAAEVLGRRVLQIDLDSIVVGSLDSIASRTADLVMWRNPSRLPYEAPTKAGRPFYNTSLLLHHTGTRTDLWHGFNPQRPMYRDDQWYLSDVLGPNMPHFDSCDGVYRIARADTPGSGVWGALPENARIVTFPGSEGKWWQPLIAEANPWIAEHRK